MKILIEQHLQILFYAEPKNIVYPRKTLAGKVKRAFKKSKSALKVIPTNLNGSSRIHKTG